MKKFTAAFLCIIMLFSILSMTGCEIGKKTEEPDNTENTAVDVEADKVVMNTANFSLTFAEFNYMFVDEFNYFLNTAYNTYGDSYLSALQQVYGYDYTKSLKDQIMYDNSGSYFNFFLESTKLKATDILIFCELAKEQGFELNDDDNASIENTVSAYLSTAEQNSTTISDIIGDKMNLTTEAVMRSYLEKNILAGKGYNYLIGTYSHTDAEIEEEFLASPKDYGFISYLTYTFQKSDSVSADAVKTYASELAGCTDPQAFTSYVENYHNTVLYAGKDSFPSFSASTLEKKNVSYAEGTDYLDWMFGEEASVNGTYTSSDETNGIYTVYMLLNEPAENAYYKKDVRHILFNASEYSSTEECKKAAEEIYDIYKKNPTEENFSTLATEYSQDPGSKEKGGLYENVGYNEMVADFENWLFDESRVEGDSGIVLTSYGYHIMYFVGNGDYVTPGHDKALEALKAVDYSNDHEALVEKHSITVDEAYMQNIDA